MSRLRTILLISFVVAFMAGTALGLLVSRSASEPPERGGSRLAGELNLNDEQREQMREIWTNVRGNSRRQWHEERAAAREQRDQAIRNLIGPDKQAAYEQIHETYAHQLEQISEARRAMYEQAREQTRQLLSPEQLTTFQQMLEQRRERGWRRGDGRRGGNGPRGRFGRRDRSDTAGDTVNNDQQ